MSVFAKKEEFTSNGVQLKFTARAGAASDFLIEVDLQLPATGITAVFGVSGCGKTSLLRSIAGLNPLIEGQIVINNETWHDANMSLPAHHRPVGFVFQEASLFEHLTAAQNLDFAQQRASASDEAIDREQIVQMMGLEKLLDRKPSQLSGGERQRVAIARALLINPRLLLLDEPLAALDVQHKQEILPYLERLHRQINVPVLYVTHSVDEVSRLADHMVVMEEGTVIEQGAVGPILSGLNLGEEAGAVLEGTVVEQDRDWQLVRFRFDGGELWVRDQGLALDESMRVRVQARDVSLSLNAVENTSILNSIPAKVVEITESDGAMALVKLALGESSLLARVSRRSVSHLGLRVGMEVWAGVKSVAILR